MNTVIRREEQSPSEDGKVVWTPLQGKGLDRGGAVGLPIGLHQVNAIGTERLEQERTCDIDKRSSISAPHEHLGYDTESKQSKVAAGSRASA